MEQTNEKDLFDFILRAKVATYAAHMKPVSPCRPESIDLLFEDGAYAYLDSYFGDLTFSGQETVWHQKNPVWTMNYCGRVIGEPFSGDFLKSALRHCPAHLPYRGPLSFEDGPYTYKMTVDGNPFWFQGYEVICHNGTPVYDLFFHGSCIKSSDAARQ